MKKTNKDQIQSQKTQLPSQKQISKPNPNPRGKTTAIVTWTVQGANWIWKKRACKNACPMELATVSLEDVWSKNPEIQDYIKSKYLITKDDNLTLGLTMSVTHSQMKGETKGVSICSITALANAGYYNEAKELQQLT